MSCELSAKEVNLCEGVPIFRPRKVEAATPMHEGDTAMGRFPVQSK
jgi:hypothetical protein